MFNFSTSSSMSESTRGWREPLSLNSRLVDQIWVFPDNWVFAVDMLSRCLGQSSRCCGVVPTATFQAKMSGEVLLRGNGWDDCWVYECWVPSKLSSILVNSSEDEMIVGCMNVEFPRNYPPFWSTHLRMRWLLGVWMLSYLEIILHSVNSSEDGMIVGCMNVEFPLKLSSVQSTRLRMG
jgi:hypothetical protein